MCEEIANAALELDSKENITCLLVMFPGAGMGDPSYPATDASAARWLMGRRGVLRRRADRKRSWGAGSTPATRARRRQLKRRNRNHPEVAVIVAC